MSWHPLRPTQNPESALLLGAKNLSYETGLWSKVIFLLRTESRFGVSAALFRLLSPKTRITWRVKGPFAVQIWRFTQVIRQSGEYRGFLLPKDGM